MSDPTSPSHLDPDAPILHLLRLRHNKTLIADMDTDALVKVVRELRTLSSQPATLDAKLRKEASGGTPKTAVSAKKKALLDSI